MEIAPSTPPPRVRQRRGIGVSGYNSRGASSSNPVDLDNDMGTLSCREIYDSRVLSSLEEETMIALDDEWTKATKEYNSLCTEELPNTVIASMAGDCSPEQNSKDAFWHAFALVDENSLGDDHVRAAWNLLNGRRVMRRGLTSSDVDTTVPTLLSHCNFSMWTVSQVESFFHDQAHPDWTTWDRLDMFLEVSAIELDVAQIREKLVATEMDSVISVESIAPLVDRFQKWHVEKSSNKRDVVQAEIVRAYWRKEELWRSYQNCNFRLRVLAEYRDALQQYGAHSLLVRNYSSHLNLFFKPSSNEFSILSVIFCNI